jgi:hypothetical protein
MPYNTTYPAIATHQFQGMLVKWEQLFIENYCPSVKISCVDDVVVTAKVVHTIGHGNRR